MSHNSATQDASASSRRITTLRQLEVLVEYMERHRNLALGRIQSKEARALASRLWNECAVRCNAAEGPYRTPKEWARYWNDIKAKVKSKLRAINQSLSGTGGGPATNVALTAMDDRVAAIIGRDVVAPLPGVQVNPFSTQDTGLDSTATTASQRQVEIIHEIELENTYSSEGLGRIPPEFHSEPRPEESESQPRPEESESQPHQAQHRPRVRRRSLLTQQAETSLDESRAAFVRLEEAKIAAQAKKLEVEIRKVEALEKIGLAINRLADAVSSTLNTAPGPSSQQVQRSQSPITEWQMSSSSDENII